MLLVSTVPGPGDAYGNGRNTFAGDTTFTSVLAGSGDSSITGITEGYDWQVYIPAKNQTVTVSGIVEGKHTGPKFCMNPVSSFQQDGQEISSPALYQDNAGNVQGYGAYIHP